MQTEDRLFQLVDHWVAEADAGRLLAVADLCRDCPDLLPEAERQIAVLRQFHALARPSTSTSIELKARQETTSEKPALDAPLGPLPGPGAKFDRYQIIAELGKGGMGIVYKVRDTRLDREVALKVMRPDTAAHPLTSDRFLREARAMAVVRHDHVVEIYDYGEVDGVRFVTMPLLAGESLDTRLERQSPLPLSEVIRIGAELADGLAAVHAKGLIHRDLKPSNVWLEAPDGRVKLLDFGLARDARANERMTATGSVVGTPAYMSPEQVNGLELDARTDLFSLGSVLYRAATGRPAFAAPTLTATLVAIGEKEPPLAQTVNPALPVELSDLIARLHRKNPADRPTSAAEVAKELRGWAAGLVAPTGDWQVSRPEATRRRWWPSPVHLAISGAVGLVLVLWMIASHITGNHTREDRAIQVPSSIPGGKTEPLRVRALEVLHSEIIDDQKTKSRGSFGKNSFGASVGDEIKVKARLSRPAYCYLIVFRPDGKDEVLYPQGADIVPEKTDEPRYPSRDLTKVYGLAEGTGLWLVALVASDKPLPAYVEWRQHHPSGPWAKSEGEANVVWVHDGQWLEEVTPRGVRTGGGRGEKEATGTTPIVRMVNWLKAETGGTVSAVGFTVEPKK